MTMKPYIYLALMAFVLLLGLGWAFGWAGIMLGTVFIVVLAASPAYRIYKLIGAINSTPEGQTANAALLHQQISTGMPLLTIVQIARALGKQISDNPDIYIWQDQHQRVQVTFENKGDAQSGAPLAVAIDLQPLTPSSDG